jgi:uncharacterized membrane protein
MPYRWIHDPKADPAAPLILQIWPHRPLTARGFVKAVGVTAIFAALPLLALLGTPLLWVMLPFGLATLAGFWLALKRSYRRGLEEVLTLRFDTAELIHRAPGKPDRIWRANPYWIQVTLYADQGPVEQYLTLKGDGREVEIGAFLGPDERIALYAELQEVFRKMSR